MAKTYFLKFGTGDPRGNTGLNPTFLLFFDQTGATLSPPSITEGLTLSGFYRFSYTPSLVISFLIDGATTSLGTVNRYISGSLDPAQLIDQYSNSLTTISTTLIASSSLLMTALGSTGDSFGSTAIDAITLFGKLNRLQEDLEGNMVFTKATGVFQFFNRGSSTMLIQKQIVDSTSQTTKT